jgi:hypothetical protein
LPLLLERHGRLRVRGGGVLLVQLRGLTSQPALELGFRILVSRCGESLELLQLELGRGDGVAAHRCDRLLVDRKFLRHGLVAGCTVCCQAAICRRGGR